MNEPAALTCTRTPACLSWRHTVSAFWCPVVHLSRRPWTRLQSTGGSAPPRTHTPRNQPAVTTTSPARHQPFVTDHSRPDERQDRSDDGDGPGRSDHRATHLGGPCVWR